MSVFTIGFIEAKCKHPSVNAVSPILADDSSVYFLDTVWLSGV